MKIYPFFRITSRINELKWFTMGNTVTLLSTFLLTIYIWDGLRSSEVFMLGSLVAFYGYILRFTNAFFNFSWQWEDIIWRDTDGQAADSILAAYDEVETHRQHRRNITDWKLIEVNHLWFQYQNDDQNDNKNHLDNVSFSLRRGEKIALVGESGSGKSTLLTLLRGLELPQRAEVSIDGRKVMDMGILSKITTLIPQDPEIFNHTIEYNITAGIQHRQDEVIQACKLARFDEVLARLPHGLATDIKEKGVNLSGGEKQRLALARGIFAAQDSSLILLDESTSSVDAINEMEIYYNLFRRFKKEGIVATIHRLHLLPLFDTIYVLEKGKVVESGSFKKLTEREDGLLAKMWQKYSANLPH